MRASGAFGLTVASVHAQGRAGLNHFTGTRVCNQLRLASVARHRL
jgi:hypothetical protein